MESIQKQRLQKIGIGFLVIVVLLTFLSKTIAGALMTKVIAEYPKYQQLIKKADAEGEVQLEEQYTVYAPVAGKIKEVFIKENTEVKAGDLLCVLDLEDIQYELKTNSLSEEKMNLQIEGNNEKISRIDEQINQVKRDIQETNKKKQNIGLIKEQGINQIDYNLVTETDQLALDNLRETVQAQQELFDIGAVAKQELEKAQLELKQKEMEIIKSQQDQLKEKQEEYKSLEEKEDSLKEKIQNLQEQKQDLLSTNQLQQIEIKQLQMNQQKLQTKMIHQGKVYATYAGVIRQVSAEIGKSVAEGSDLFKIGATDGGYSVNVKVEERIDFIAIGQEVDLTITSLQKNDIKGKITSIEKKEHMQSVTISFNETGLQGGEKVKVQFIQKCKDKQNLLSYVAVQKDNDGDFIYLLKKIKSPLGEDYVVTRKAVQVIDYTDSQVAVSDSLQDNEMILVSSEKAVKIGERVKVENETALLAEQK